MSLEAITHVLPHDYGNPTRKLIMIALANYANEKRRAYPSIDTIARIAQTSPRTVQGHLRKLEVDGYISIAPQAGPHGTNVYAIRVFEKESTPETPPAEIAPPPQILRGNCSNEGEKNNTPPAISRRQIAPEPKEPKKEREESPAEIAPPPQSDHFSTHTRGNSDDLPAFHSHIAAVYTDAPATYTANEQQHLALHRLTLESISEQHPEFWTAMRAWNQCSDTVRQRSRWPRTRHEFLQNLPEVIEHVLPWWRRHGRTWWQRTKGAPKGKKPKQNTPETPPREPMTPEELRRMFAEVKEETDTEATG